ncbi:aldo/keto reductase [Methanococcus voltae]|uniref:Putative aldo/keto reductase-like oxidoreductase n=1 Tax=Methanococcus voltae TaxID=2188 RepID=A0A8J7UTC7_METVO|nr:aldo/keto reductase [Methanococcus voltae]MBP2172544.1 putative aldo/keto reductase-like oxidoreductase [Methanococcus voltae]MBP2201549.1 putative aldo/keto reductase-like oxidoreductase [Methanococcus voltae]
MYYRTVPKNGEKISILGFGAMRLPEYYGKIDEEKAEELFVYAIKNGLNFIDTAVPYHNGNSESFVGKILNKHDLRDKVKISTKLSLGSSIEGGNELKNIEDMENYLDKQLEKLKTDYIDYYLVHAITKQSWEKLKSLDVFEFLEKAKKEGKIKNTGFSTHEDYETFKKIVDAYDWDVCLIQYNYIDQNTQITKKGLEYAKSKNLGIFIMEPLRGGKLVYKVPKEVKKIMDEYRTSYDKDINSSNPVDNPVDWSFNWLWGHPEITCVLSGMNYMPHLIENVELAKNFDLEKYNIYGDSESTLKYNSFISKIAQIYDDKTKINCTDCNYCSPCTADIAISRIFELYNDKHIFEDENDYTRAYYAKLDYMKDIGGVNGVWKNASKCIECNECIEKCPQHLDIPNLLKKVALEFEGNEEYYEYKVELIKYLLNNDMIR